MCLIILNMVFQIRNLAVIGADERARGGWQGAVERVPDGCSAGRIRRSWMPGWHAGGSRRRISAGTPVSDIL